jgi:pyruvate-formate lyase-activating enzyme
VDLAGDITFGESGRNAITFQTGAFTLDSVEEVLRQAREVGTVEWIYFEGGEPFLYYGTLLAGARLAAEAGFRVGVVSNGYWAISERDAAECLRPFAGLVGDLSISSDLYHYDEPLSRQAANADAAAAALGIPADTIQVAHRAQRTSCRSRASCPPAARR